MIFNDDSTQSLIVPGDGIPDNTYILYSGNASMTARSDYFRLDGPRVCIEFSVQNGMVMRGIHYHSVWRDGVTDYNGIR